ncbi:hypothetical protein ACVWXO_003207 [Bradyrhizobium sp. LM2.7]
MSRLDLNRDLRSYAAEPDVLIEQLRQDEAIAEADTLLLTAEPAGRRVLRACDRSDFDACRACAGVAVRPSGFSHSAVSLIIASQRVRARRGPVGSQ